MDEINSYNVKNDNCFFWIFTTDGELIGVFNKDASSVPNNNHKMGNGN